MRGRNGNSLNREPLHSGAMALQSGSKISLHWHWVSTARRPATLDGWPSKAFDQN